VSQAVIPQQTADESHLTMLADLATWKSLVATQHYERVYAPFDGMITVRNLYPGALVATGTASGTSNPSIYEIATLNQLRVYVYLPQTYAPFVRDGEPSVVTVNEYPDRDYNGMITRHPSALDQALIFNGERVYVPIVQDHRIHLVDMRLGLNNGINCEVTRGLKGDETVALGLGQAAVEGELIRPLMAKGD
jgi:hypothetical protein